MYVVQRGHEKVRNENIHFLLLKKSIFFVNRVIIMELIIIGLVLRGKNVNNCIGNYPTYIFNGID